MANAPRRKPPRKKHGPPDPGGPSQKPPKHKHRKIKVPGRKPPKHHVPIPGGGGGGGKPPPKPKPPPAGGPAPSAGQQDVLVIPDDTQQISQMPTDYPEDESVFSSGEGSPPQYHYRREAAPGQVYIEQQSEPASGPGQAGQTG